MKWVTRRQIRVNRTATCWLVRRFIDPAAEFIFVEPDHVASIASDQSATGFDAPNATYPHKNEKGSGKGAVNASQQGFESRIGSQPLQSGIDAHEGEANGVLTFSLFEPTKSTVLVT